MEHGSTVNFIQKIPKSAWRKVIQAAAFGFTNFRVENFAKGTIYTGKWKEFCVPGLNCYSCPAASFACPIGAMQAIAGSRQMNFSFYVVGIILAFGVILGRAVCGFLCPFGLIQELLHLIPVPKRKLKKAFRFLKYLKYVILVLFVLILPAAVLDASGLGLPWFCEYICPAGTLEAGIPLLLSNSFLAQSIGSLFYLKAAILLAVVILCMFVYRFFCKVLCPLGVIYGLLNKISLYHVKFDASKCVSCGQCAKSCKMEIDPSKELRSTECILCGRCTSACRSGALKMSWKPEHGAGDSPATGNISPAARHENPLFTKNTK